MPNYWLIVDISGMAYRALNTMGKLSNEGAATGVVYGCYLAIKQLMEEYDTQNLVAVFDGGHAFRSQLLPGYKEGRKKRRAEASPEERQARADLVRQLADLRTVHLPACGVRNVLWYGGYEADDIISAFVQMLAPEDAAAIVSSDEDLWQCLRPGVQWVSLVKQAKHPKLSYARFVAVHGIEPCQWPHVKAWGGCSSDDIPGLPGVGEKIALKWVRGEIPASSTYYDRFINGVEVFNRNLQLTKLPAAGLPPPQTEIQEKTINWEPLLRAIGAKVPNAKEKQGFGFA